MINYSHLQIERGKISTHRWNLSKFVMHKTFAYQAYILHQRRHENAYHIASWVRLAMWNVHGRTQGNKCTGSARQSVKFLSKLDLCSPAFAGFFKVRIFRYPDLMIRWVEQWNLNSSWTQCIYIYDCSWYSWLTMQFNVGIGLDCLFHLTVWDVHTKSKYCHAVYRQFIVTNSI